MTGNAEPAAPTAPRRLTPWLEVRRTASRTHGSRPARPGRQAETPAQIPARGWFQVLRRSFKQVGDDHLTLIAGGIAYTWFLALFPGIIAAVLIWGLVADPAQIQQQISDLAASLPARRRAAGDRPAELCHVVGRQRRRYRGG